MAGRPLTSAAGTFGTIVGTAQMSLLDTLTSSIFSSGFNDSALGWVNYGADIGTANNYAVTLTQAPSAYVAGMSLVMTPANDNTGASVVNVNSVGNVPIVNKANLALSGGEITKNKTISMVYDGTSFRIVSFCPLAITLGTISSTATSVECAGYDSVIVAVTFTGASYTLTLLHLSWGVPVIVKFTNGAAGSRVAAVLATNSSNTSYTSMIIVPGGGIGTSTDMVGGGVSIPAGQTRIMSGMSLQSVNGVMFFT